MLARSNSALCLATKGRPRSILTENHLWLTLHGTSFHSCRILPQYGMLGRLFKIAHNV